MKVDSKLIYTISGATVMLASAVTVADYAVRKRKCALQLIGGIAGMVLGTCLVYEPERKARKELTVKEMFDEDDTVRADRQIDEVLNKRADHGRVENGHVRRVEVDEEASEKDFI